MKDQNTRRRPGRPRSQESEDSILNVTLDLLGKVGFQGLTIEAVSSMARVSKSTIYRRWASKEELVIAAFDRAPDLEVPAQGNVRDDLIYLLKQLRDYVQTTPLSHVLPTIVGACASNPRLMDTLEPVILRRREATREILNRAIENKEINGDIPIDTMADMLTGPVLLRMFFMRGDVSDAALSCLVNTVLEGIAARTKRKR